MPSAPGRQFHRGQDMHGDTGGADRMALGLQPAGGIDRQLAVLLGPAFLMARAPCPASSDPWLHIDQLGDGEAVMGLDKDRSSSFTPAEFSARCQASQPSKAGCRASTSAGSPGHALARKATALPIHRRLGVGKDQGGGAVGDQRAVGALERAGDERVLLALGAAELVTKILAHLRIGIGDAVLVVLRGDHRQRVGLVANAGNRPARSCRRRRRNHRRVAVLRQIRRLQQVLADLGPGVLVICSAPTTSTIFARGGDA